MVKFGDATDIRGIIQLLTCRLGGGQRAFSHLYSMRMVNTVTGDIHCLHQDTTMYQVSGRGYHYIMVAMSHVFRCTRSMRDTRRSGDTSCE